MQIHARIEVFESMTTAEDLARIRRVFGESVQSWNASGKLKYSGIFANKRGGIFIFDVDSDDELFSFMAPLVDFSTIDVQPLISVETLGKFFAENPLE